MSVGNCPVKTIENLLRKHFASIYAFDSDEKKSYLALP